MEKAPEELSPLEGKASFMMFLFGGSAAADVCGWGSSFGRAMTVRSGNRSGQGAPTTLSLSCCAACMPQIWYVFVECMDLQQVGDFCQICQGKASVYSVLWSRGFGRSLVLGDDPTRLKRRA